MTNTTQETKSKKEKEKSIEYKMDALVGYILLVGVLTSITLIVSGVIWHYVDTGHIGLDYSIAGMNLFQFVLTEIHQFTRLHLRPRLLVNLGIAALMLTPYVRVAASMLFFAFAERNYKYTTFTAIVFVVLTYSLFLR
ncbi:MAG TPA: DUF1634 domain-containing protein [Candidatus Acidoferrales bacterium]|nr:DUF1634 domain-containing protein [Candidatus Acidoferrales bacterium]